MFFKPKYRAKILCICFNFIAVLFLFLSSPWGSVYSFLHSIYKYWLVRYSWYTCYSHRISNQWMWACESVLASVHSALNTRWVYNHGQKCWHIWAKQTLFIGVLPYFEKHLFVDSQHSLSLFSMLQYAPWKLWPGYNIGKGRGDRNVKIRQTKQVFFGECLNNFCPGLSELYFTHCEAFPVSSLFRLFRDI